MYFIRFISLNTVKIIFILSIGLILQIQPANAAPRTATSSEHKSDALVPPDADFFRSLAPKSNPVVAPGNSKIDILVAYTKDTINTLGSVEAVENEIKRMVANANQVLLNSGTGLSLSLVKIHGMNYYASGTLGDVLYDSYYQYSAEMAKLHVLRKQYAADLVSIIVDGSGDSNYCGLGWINGVGYPIDYDFYSMFSVSAIKSACDRSTFIHEIGHNLGSTHDHYNAQGEPMEKFSYGHRFNGKSGQEWITIMSYYPGIRIPYFSSPLKTFDGRPVGVEGYADNATSIQISGPVVANFYKSLNLPDLSAGYKIKKPKILVKRKFYNSGYNVKATVTVKDKSKSLKNENITLYWSYGKKGILNAQFYGRTDSKGKLKYSDLAYYGTVYHRYCLSDFYQKMVCSKPLYSGKKRR